MRQAQPKLMILVSLLAFQTFSPVLAQETVHQVLDLVDLPSELNPNNAPGCMMEFQEDWLLNAAGLSVSKVVNEFAIYCEDSSDLVFQAEGKLHLKEISYEFSFLDLQKEAGHLLREEAVQRLQSDFIELISSRSPLPEVYDPPEQLLSIYFHEEWMLDVDQQDFQKRVKGITPVIWQQRQTTDGEPLPDAVTGYPVYYKLKLDRIDLRQP